VNAAFPRLVFPDTVPTTIPSFDPNERLDPRRFGAVGPDVSPPEDFGPRSVPAAAVFVEAVVDEAPEALSFPPIEYPRALLEARIAGTVLLEAVIDTTGRVEPESVRVIRTTHRAFEVPARDAMRRALFRAGRVRGQRVRVLVHLPLRFVPGG
jgi:TonB family protein